LHPPLPKLLLNLNYYRNHGTIINVSIKSVNFVEHIIFEFVEDFSKLIAELNILLVLNLVYVLDNIFNVMCGESFIQVKLVVLLKDFCHLLFAVGQVIDVHLRKRYQDVVEVIVLKLLVQLQLQRLNQRRQKSLVESQCLHVGREQFTLVVY